MKQISHCLTYLRSLIAAASLFAVSPCGATTLTDTTYARVDRVMEAIPVYATGSTKDIAQYINSKFTTNKDKVRAAYAWTANNIAYDAEHMLEMYYEDEQYEQHIKEALGKHLGLCMDYVEIFCHVCKEAGIDAQIVRGYMRINGSYAYLPHEWCAVRIDTSWYLVDPTWGAGYISNKHFVKQFSNDWFLRSPTAMLKTHMPFDPMWQLSHYPIKYDDFYDGKKTEDNTRPYFSYSDSIAAYEQLGSEAQKEAEVRHMNSNGIKCDVAANYVHIIEAQQTAKRRSRETAAINEQVNKYKTAEQQYYKCAVHFNQFLSYRKAHFRPMRSDAEIQEMIDVTADELKNAFVALNSITDSKGDLAELSQKLRTQMNEAAERVEEQQEFVKTYLSKGKAERRAMVR